MSARRTFLAVDDNDRPIASFRSRELAERWVARERARCWGRLGPEVVDVVELPHDPPLRPHLRCQVCRHAAGQHQQEQAPRTVLVARVLPQGSEALGVPPGGTFSQYVDLELLVCSSPGCSCRHQDQVSSPQLAPVFPFRNLFKEDLNRAQTKQKAPARAGPRGSTGADQVQTGL